MTVGVKPQELRAIEQQVQQLKQLNQRLNQQIIDLAIKRRSKVQSSIRKKFQSNSK